MWFERLRLELGMELAAEIPGMIGDLADLNVNAVGSLPGKLETVRRQEALELTIEFISMAMPLADLSRTISSAGEAALRQFARIGSKAHGAAEFIYTFQFTKFIDYAIGRRRIELGRVRSLEPAYVASILNDHCLHAETNPEVRHFLLAGITNGVD